MEKEVRSVEGLRAQRSAIVNRRQHQLGEAVAHRERQAGILLCLKAVSYTHLTLPTIYSV